MYVIFGLTCFRPEYPYGGSSCDQVLFYLEPKLSDSKTRSRVKYEGKNGDDSDDDLKDGADFNRGQTVLVPNTTHTAKAPTKRHAWTGRAKEDSKTFKPGTKPCLKNKAG